MALSPQVATDTLRRVVRDGAVAWSRRALDRAKADGVTTIECAQAMLRGVCDPPALEHGLWRYRVHCPRLCVVVIFRDDDEAVVVDAWRKLR